MNALPSTEFRKRFARLTEATEVTVNGHVIGTWRPINAPVQVFDLPARPVIDEDVVDFGLGTPSQQAAAATRIDQGKAGVTVIERTFNSRPFTPVPKSGRNP